MVLVSLSIAAAADAGVPGLLVEPLYRKLARWEVAVLSSAEDGPVALLPAELEQYSPLDELADADLALQEWQMMQVRCVKLLVLWLCCVKHVAHWTSWQMMQVSCISQCWPMITCCRSAMLSLPTG
jgi:hypothetical protein